MGDSTDINELRAKLVEAREKWVTAVGSDNITGKKIDGSTIPDATRINSMTSARTIQKHIKRLKEETDRLNNLTVDRVTEDMGTASSPGKVEEPDSDDDEFHDPQVDIQQIVIPPRFQQPQQQPQQNLVLYQDPALLNHFQRIERSTLIDLDRDLKNAGIDDETIRNLSMDEKQEYAKLIRELNYGGPSKLVGSAPNPKFKDLLDNRYADQYIFEANKAAVLDTKPRLPPIEELWRRRENLKSVPASEARYSKFINLKQLNPFEKFALLHNDNRPGVVPRYKNQGAAQKDAPIVYGGKLYVQKRIPTNPTRLVV
jgi:hypothetical protein